MSNPAWDESMPSWNRTTECEKCCVFNSNLFITFETVGAEVRCCRFLLVRSEDWVPCDFPYTGLSGYEPDPAYCYDTFAESLPNPIAYTIAQCTYVAAFLPFVLIFVRRVILIFVDMKLLSFEIPFHSSNVNYSRVSRRINSHDQCNIMCFFIVLFKCYALQLI